MRHSAVPVGDEVELALCASSVASLKSDSNVRSEASGSTLVQRHVGHSSWLATTGHLVTVMVGAGVLSLPSAMSWLGWVGGLACLVVFFLISLWCSLLLTAVYKVDGRRHATYSCAVRSILGKRSSYVLAVVQHTMLCLASIGYSIAAADSMTYIAQRSCAGQHTCALQKHWQMTLVFGALQLLLSLLPNLESLSLVSAVGAVMSVGYSLLTISLGASQASNGLGSPWGKAALPGDRSLHIFNALGQMAFAYGCAVVQLEVQDTLQEPPDAEVSMRRSVTASISTAFVMYVLVSVLCYLALGDAAPGMVLTSFRSAAPWATLLANALVLVHMVSAFRVFCQPNFAAIESALALRWPRMGAWAQISCRRLLLMRLCIRGAYVAILTAVALVFPFFGAFVGLIGAVAFWPLSVYFPIRMFTAVRHTGHLSRAVMVAVNVLMALLSLGAAAGSLADIIQSAGRFTLG